MNFETGSSVIDWVFSASRPGVATAKNLIIREGLTSIVELFKGLLPQGKKNERKLEILISIYAQPVHWVEGIALGE